VARGPGRRPRRLRPVRRITRLTIAAGAPDEALRGLIRVLALEPEELVAEGGAAEALRAAGVEGIEAAGADAAVSLPPETDEYAAALAVAAETFAAAERGEGVDVGRVQLAVERLHGAPAGALWPQVRLRLHDELDPPHAVNVAFLAMQTAQALGLPGRQQVDLGLAAFLHDVGMAPLPWEERLRERTAVAAHDAVRHAAQGAYLLRHLGGRESLPMLAAAEHHRVFSGRGAAVSPHSRLVALADYLDAMTCGRVGGLRPATVGGLLSSLLAGEGPGFDPLHLRALARLLVEAQV